MYIKQEEQEVRAAAVQLVARSGHLYLKKAVGTTCASSSNLGYNFQPCRMYSTGSWMGILALAEVVTIGKVSFSDGIDQGAWPKMFRG
jgi:hypothetical protein